MNQWLYVVVNHNMKTLFTGGYDVKTWDGHLKNVKQSCVLQLIRVRRAPKRHFRGVQTMARKPTGKRNQSPLWNFSLNIFDNVAVSEKSLDTLAVPTLSKMQSTVLSHHSMVMFLLKLWRLVHREKLLKIHFLTAGLHAPLVEHYCIFKGHEPKVSTHSFTITAVCIFKKRCLPWTQEDLHLELCQMSEQILSPLVSARK